jgi:hypothetical protein
MLEYWSIGVLEYWSIGVLEYWSIGVLEYWSGGVVDASSPFSFRANVYFRLTQGKPG